ncbi:DUF3304 domain-containing protein [Pseudoduganella sp.]|uniref:DUF3304 domain-containing protein n=1 Tax=Pseudoduganella sp. TaxID=1880898 RepID=UPI0035B2CBE7
MQIFRISVAAAMSLVAAGCDASSSVAAPTPLKEEYGLTIVGYNYTSRYIHSFSVDGQGGGNIHVSSATSGGGGSVCCASYFPSAKNTTVAVRWQASACRYIHSIHKNGEKEWAHHGFFKEREVPVMFRADGEPAYLEVHIFPDEHVEAFVTSKLSKPRLLLKKDRANDSEYPRCPNDKEPE